MSPSIKVYVREDNDDEPTLVCKNDGRDFHVAIEDDNGNIVSSASWTIPAEDE